MKKLLISAGILLTYFTGNTQILNGGFEDWNTTSWDSPNYSESSASDYPGSIIKSTDKQQGNYALEMHNYISSEMGLSASYIVYGVWRDQGPESGYPYTQTPTTINGYYKSNLVNDSAIVGCVFFKNGTALSTQFFYLTGVHSAYTPFSFNLSSFTQAPDSALLVATSSNSFGTIYSINSWILLDNITFGGPGITQQIPNTDFEQWTSYSFSDPTSWNSDNNELIRNGKNPNVSFTTPAHSGSKALQIVTDFTIDGDGYLDMKREIRNFEHTQNYKVGGIKYNGGMQDTLVGYYKYFPINMGDNGFVNCEFYKSGYGQVNPMSGGHAFLYSASNYTKFVLPLDFSFPGVIPDTVFISIGSTEWPGDTTDRGSKLIIDDLQFLSAPLSVKNVVKSKTVLSFYPNPAAEIASISFNLDESTDICLEVRDVTGRIVYKNPDAKFYEGLNKIILNTSSFTSGNYTYSLIGTNGFVINGKFNVSNNK